MDGLTEVKSIFQQARDGVNALSTDDPQAFTEALTKLGERLRQAGQDVSQSFSNIQNPDLQSAFTAEPSCGSLGSAS